MDSVDADWIKARLTGRHGEKSEIARAIGVSSKQMSEILAGVRRIQHSEALRLMEHFGEAPAPPAHAGLEEGAAEFVTPEPGSLAQELLRVVRRQFPRAELYRVTEGDVMFATLPGDMLILDLSRRPETGDTVICTVTDVQTDASRTLVRKFIDPWLINSNAHTRIDANDQGIGILGPVVGLVRGSGGGGLLSPDAQPIFP